MVTVLGGEVEVNVTQPQSTFHEITIILLVFWPFDDKRLLR